MCLSGRTCADFTGSGSVTNMFIMWRCIMIVPVTNVACNDKTIGNYKLKKDKRSDNTNNIIILFGSLILERTKSILPYFPYFIHLIISMSISFVHTSSSVRKLPLSFNLLYLFVAIFFHFLTTAST